MYQTNAILEIKLKPIIITCWILEKNKKIKPIYFKACETISNYLLVDLEEGKTHLYVESTYQRNLSFG